MTSASSTDRRVADPLAVAVSVAVSLMLGVAGAAAADRPEIMSRADWGAKPPSMAMAPHEVERITIHHTGVLRSTKRPTEQLVRNLQAFSQSAGKLADGRDKVAWADIPYHFYVGRDGAIVEGRDAGFAGDTNTRYDPAGHLGIAVAGNYGEQELTEAQRASLTALVLWAAETFDVPADRIGGHGDYARTSCPGADVEAFLPELRERVADAS